MYMNTNYTRLKTLNTLAILSHSIGTCIAHVYNHIFRIYLSIFAVNDKDKNKFAANPMPLN